MPVGSDSAEAVIEQVQKTASKAHVVPIFTRMTDWTEYTDDAVINAVNATDAAISVFGGDKTAKSYDGSDQKTTTRRASSRSSYSEDEDDSEDEGETVSSSLTSRSSRDSEDADSDNGDEDEDSSSYSDADE